jgi:AMP deaminase
MDLDQVLDISSDGPSKSFAFRRLQYLEGKWNLYILLNEHQEMADSKVSDSSAEDQWFQS